MCIPELLADDARSPFEACLTCPVSGVEEKGLIPHRPFLSHWNTLTIDLFALLANSHSKCHA